MMPKLHIAHSLLSSAAILGIGILWYDFNKKVYERVSHLLDIMLCETAEEENERREKETRRIEKEERRLQEETKRLEEKKRIEEEEKE